jgi:ATP-dependent DNA helicase RecG
MTATPIPRTLTMSIYGDLDVSIIDELPPGRKDVVTVHRKDKNRLKVFAFLKDQIKYGRQIYIVYPLIEESKKMDLKFLEDGYESLIREFPKDKYQIGILHGKMNNKSKDYEMKRFVDGKTNLLISTTVIEVGVNVPNSSVMIIESAERFGLSQLHQLRGRVGRGNYESYCILMTKDSLSDDAKTRIKAMTTTNNGFKISEIDLKLRGPGDVLGTRQSGDLGFKLGDIVNDTEIFNDAFSDVKKILSNDSGLKLVSNNNIKRFLVNYSKNKSWNIVG